MKRVLSMVLTIIMAVSIFSTVLNIEVVSGEPMIHSVSSVTSVITPSIETSTPTPNPNETDLQINIGSLKGKTGDMVTVPINLKNVPKNGIYCADMVVSYDPSQMEWVSIEVGSIVPNSEVCFDSSNPYLGDIRLLYCSDFVDSSYIATDGVFANITFKLLGSYDRSAKIFISKTTIGDKDIREYPVKTVSGCVDISGSEPIPDFKVEIGSAKGYIGDLITIPVSFSNIPDESIQTMNMTLNYDSTRLQYVSYESGSIVPFPNCNFEVNKEHKGQIKILYTDYLCQHGNVIKSDGVIVNLTFRLVYFGESTVYASNGGFYDASLNEVKAMFISGQVSQSEPPIEVCPTEPPLISKKFGINYGHFYQMSDSPSVFPISFENVPPTAIRSFSMTIDYDPTKLEYVDSAKLFLVNLNSEEIHKTKEITIQEVSDRSFKVSYEASEEMDFVNNEGGFMHLFFNVLSPSTNDVSIQVKDVTLADKYGNPVDAELFSEPIIETSIGTVLASSGSTVVVPIKLESIPECGVRGIFMDIAYNTEGIEYVSSEDGDIMPYSSSFTATQVGGNKLRVCLYMGSDPLTNTGDIAYITFKVKDKYGSYPIKFEYVPEILTSSLGWSKVLVTNGGVKIVDEDQIGYTVSGFVYSNIGSTNLSKYAFNEGFKVELTWTDLSAVTDSNGYFEIKNVPVGKHTAVITKANHLSTYIENISVDKDKMLSTASSPITLWYGDIEENGKQDGAINLEDIMQICKAFNSVSGDGVYKGNLDLNKDGAINLEDVMIVAKNFNKCSSDYNTSAIDIMLFNE